ncbi:unnamed protein product [Pleuronectes platessa]|uniref:Uncharacterized protein n=1 Tax=Pleuronectes platessa TaxID=8262 RepID=A0A9N7VRP3_PLEPL|nr:unnamed protein product [Pleuronectes platessa]
MHLRAFGHPVHPSLFNTGTQDGKTDVAGVHRAPAHAQSFGVDLDVLYSSILFPSKIHLFILHQGKPAVGRAHHYYNYSRCRRRTRSDKRALTVWRRRAQWNRTRADNRFTHTHVDAAAVRDATRSPETWRQPARSELCWSLRAGLPSCPPSAERRAGARVRVSGSVTGNRIRDAARERRSGGLAGADDHLPWSSPPCLHTGGIR